MNSSNRNHIVHRENAGIALMLALVFLAGMTAMVSVMATRIVAQHRQVDSFVDFQLTFQGMQAGLMEARAEIYLAENIDEGQVLADRLIDGRIGVKEDLDLYKSPPSYRDANFQSVVTPQRLNGAPAMDYFAYAIDWENDGVDNNGALGVDDDAEKGMFTIIASARVGAIVRTSETIIEGANVNVWQNAIFAGQGQAGGVINGNVSVHGSLHILGENLDPGDEAINALALGGSSIIANSYCCGGGSGLSDELRARVPALEETTVNGKTVETLEATVRVKEGAVSLSGSANIGLADDPNSGEKESMDGVFVNDNWTNLDTSGEPENVYSDNGTNAEYDLGEAVEFPTFESDRGESHLDNYLEDFSLDGSTPCQILEGDLAIEAAANNFFWRPCTGELSYTVPGSVSGSVDTGTAPNLNEIPGRADLAAIPDGEPYIWFDASTKELVIQGRIPVDGDVMILAGNGANNRSITYEGIGSIMAYDGGTGHGEGDVTLDVSLVTPEVRTDGRGRPLEDPTFPKNVLGIMAGNNLELGVDTSQLELMGGFYAQNQVNVAKQTTIMGSIVSNEFNIGRNVPDIYQVLPLAEALQNDAIRMIGSNPLIVLRRLSWRELGVE